MWILAEGNGTRRDWAFLGGEETELESRQVGKRRATEVLPRRGKVRPQLRCVFSPSRSKRLIIFIHLAGFRRPTQNMGWPRLSMREFTAKSLRKESAHLNLAGRGAFRLPQQSKQGSRCPSFRSRC